MIRLLHCFGSQYKAFIRRKSDYYGKTRFTKDAKISNPLFKPSNFNTERREGLENKRGLKFRVKDNKVRKGFPPNGPS